VCSGPPCFAAQRGALLGWQRAEPLIELAERNARFGEGAPSQPGLDFARRRWFHGGARGLRLREFAAVDDDSVQPSRRLERRSKLPAVRAR